MAIRLEQVAKASECNSISRAGRMTESLAVRARVTMTPTSPKKKQLPIGIDLSILEDEPVSQGQDGFRDKELCSSSRVHPENQQRDELLRKEVMERNFLKDMSVFRSSPIETMASPAQTHKKTRTHSPIVKQKLSMTSSFLSIDRDRWGANVARDQPPVGHYHPRMTIVETSPTFVSFTKAKREIGGAENESTTYQPAEVIVETSPLKRSKSSASASTPEPTSVPKAKKSFSPCFLTVSRPPIVSGDFSPSQASRNVNDNHFVKHVKGFDMSRQNGRFDRASAAPRDLTGRDVPAPHIASVNMARLSPRDMHKASSSVDMPQTRLNISNFEKFKFRESHSHNLSHSGKWSPLKVASISRASELAVIHPPEARHLPSVAIGTLVGRDRHEARSFVPLEYDVDMSAVEPHTPSVKFSTVSNERVASPTNFATEIGNVPAADNLVVRRKLTHDIRFDALLSREAAGKSGRTPHKQVLCTASEMRPIKDDFADHIKGGDPMMQTHIDREKRDKQRSPALCAPDTVYEISLEPVSRGYVEFGKMVSRERHQGSHFANAV